MDWYNTVVTAVKEQWNESTDTEKAEVKAYLCTGLPTALATYLGALTVMPLTGIGIAGAGLVAGVTAATVGYTSASITKNNIEQAELELSKKQ